MDDGMDYDVQTNEGNADIHRPQCRRTNPLAHKNAVHHIVEIGHKQPTHSWEDVPA